MVMLPGRVKPIWPSAAAIAALAWSALRLSGAGMDTPRWPGSRRFPAGACRLAGVSAGPGAWQCIRLKKLLCLLWREGRYGSPVPAPAGWAEGPRRQAVAATAARGLRRFAAARGIPASREFLLDYDVIEAFCVAGLPGRASSTRGTYRSALYRLARPVHGAPGQRATLFAGARAPAPYSPAERAELAAVAAAQRGPAKRASALALVVFGIGAGLRAAELVALRGSDVSRRGRRVTVRVGGPAARVVPVTAAYAGRAAGLAAGAGHAHLFRPGPADRGYKNFGACQIFCVSRGSRCPFVILLWIVSGVRVRRGRGRGT